MSKSILFYWGKGADMRIKLLNIVSKCNKKNEPCYINLLAEKLGLSHVAVKKHIDLMLEEGFLEEINPGGKPIYLKLARSGEEVLNEFKGK